MKQKPSRPLFFFASSNCLPLVLRSTGRREQHREPRPTERVNKSKQVAHIESEGRQYDRSFCSRQLLWTKLFKVPFLSWNMPQDTYVDNLSGCNRPERDLQEPCAPIRAFSRRTPHKPRSLRPRASRHPLFLLYACFLVCTTLPVKKRDLHASCIK